MLKKLVLAAVLLFPLALYAQYPACANNVTAADYANTYCTQNDGTSGPVNYYFPSNWFVSTGSKTVTSSDLTIRLDPNGAYTFLFSSSKFSVNPGEQVKVVLNFQVQGATEVNPWSHNCHITGPGMDGEIGFSEKIVGAGGVTATATCTYGNSSPNDYESFAATGTLNTQIIMELDGNSGHATLDSFGAHYHP